MTATPPHSLLPIDVAVLRQCIRWTMLRPVHLVALSGASPWTIRGSLRRLTATGMVTSEPVTATLRDQTGRLRRTITFVYVATAKGAGHAGSWVVPGTGGVTVNLPAPRPSAALSDHVLGVADLAAWYASFHGPAAVVAEREILSLERPSKLTPARQVSSYWSVPVPRRVGIHPPDLGLVAPDGSRWAIELERATKSVADYTEVVAAYQQAGMGQVWHVLSKSTGQRLAQACHQLGIRVAATSDGVNVSADGKFRLQGWLPAQSSGGGPETWQSSRLVPVSAPGGLPTPAQRPDLSASWRRGSLVDPEDPWGAESVLVA